MIIGITGKSGAGKSYLSDIIAQKLDFLHVDIDKISHEVLAFPETISFLHQEFEKTIFENNKLNRKKLGEIVFNNPQKLQLLNNFCQIQIENRLSEIIANSTKSIILDYALLNKLNQFKLCDIKILLNTHIETRFSRVSEREKISKEYFLSRDNSLEPYNNCDFDYVFDDISQKDIQTIIEIISQYKEKQC